MNSGGYLGFLWSTQILRCSLPVSKLQFAVKVSKMSELHIRETLFCLFEQFC